MNNPFALEAGLAADLAALAQAAERAHALYRPAVVRHLFLGGWRPLHAWLGDGEAARAALTSVWRLMLESVTTGRFGVSSDAWREHAAYPDRFFPRLWLDTLPGAALGAEEMLEAAAALFNLGERLADAPRAASNAVAEALFERRGALAGGGWREAARAGLVRAGLLPAGEVAPSEWRRARRVGALRLGEVDPEFVVGEVRWEREGEGRGAGMLVVEDALRGVRARARVTEAGVELEGVQVQVQGEGEGEERVQGKEQVQGGGRRGRMEGGRGGSHGGGGRGAEGVVRLEGRAIVVRAGREARVVGRVDALWPLPLAARGDGMVAVGDALSQEVVAWRLEP